MFHPSEADPDFGYQSRPYTIKFGLDDDPSGSYILRIHYLVIAPRLAYLEININCTNGNANLRPSSSESGEIQLHSGLHTTIYSDGIIEVTFHTKLLNQRENVMELIKSDAGK